MIKNNQWDGVNRLDKFIQTVQTTNNSVSHRLIKTWMIAAIAAAHSATGFVNQGVLVLQGKQDIGKTRWVKSLDPINCDAVKEGAILDPANKDNVTTLAKHWIVELGELDATFRKADIARLKSFITMQADDVRLPYARRHTRMPRRTAYIATVNDNNFLADDTGNRRWWTITVNSINFNHGLDMIQVWSEVYQLWINGALTYLSDDLKISVNEINESHEKVEPFQELLSSRFDWDSTARQELTATQVLIELGYKAPTLSETQRMGNSLQKTKCSFRKINGTTRYSIPYLLIRKF
jgi:putative DNA primase/helicase